MEEHDNDPGLEFASLFLNVEMVGDLVGSHFALNYAAGALKSGLDDLQALGALGQIIEYVDKRSPSGEVLAAKLHEISPSDFPFVPWAERLPLYRLAHDAFAGFLAAYCKAVGMHFPPPAAPAPEIPKPKIEDTIFEAVGSLGERDEHAIKAAELVAGVQSELARKGIKVEMKVVSIDDADAGASDEPDDAADDVGGEGDGEEEEDGDPSPSEPPAPKAKKKAAKV